MYVYIYIQLDTIVCVCAFMYDYISVNLNNIHTHDTFCQFNTAIGDGPFRVDFPLDMVIFGSYVNVERLYFIPSNAYQIPLIQQ